MRLAFRSLWKQTVATGDKGSDVNDDLEQGADPSAVGSSYE
jgi:hypothetical protein